MKKKYQNAFFIFGIALLMLMATQLDFRQVAEGLQRAGYWFVAVIVLWFFLYIFNTAAWFVRERDKTCGGAIAGLIHQFE